MMQLDLFDRDKVLRAEIRAALVGLDFRLAGERCRQYAKIPGAASLEWELDVLHFIERHARRRLSLEAGVRLWEEFESSLFFGRIPSVYALDLEKSYFSRLLAANRTLFDSTNSPERALLAPLYMRAGQAKNARRLIQKEIEENGENWELRLLLGNCFLSLGESSAARVNYTWAALCGLPETAIGEVEDHEFAELLRSGSAPGWGFAEAAAEGVVRVPRFKSREDFESFVFEFVDRIEGNPDGSSPPCRFAVWLTLSENRRLCSGGQLEAARRRLKELNPRLHAVYMTRLESEGR
jgi:hypothetical protein